MSNGFSGADVAQLRLLAAAMQSAGNVLQAQLGTLNARVSGVTWPGPDADGFRIDWKSSHSMALREAVFFLHQASTDLTRHASEQESASTEGGSGSSVVHTGIPSRVPGPGDLHGRSMAQVQDWWANMTDGQRAAFIREHPVEAGNTNGIPFDARVEANRINAQNRIDWLNQDDPEPMFNPILMDAGYPQRFAAEHEAWEKRQSGRAYLQKVVDGKIQLVAYDPASSSIIEMIGDYNAGTSTVITYVPGTMTNEASFYGGGPQELPNRFVQADKSGSTVAFAYKGSEFPDGTFPEAFLVEAKSDEFVAAASPVLKAFQDAVELEKPAGAQTVGVGHSWGLRNLTGSETDGAHFDKLLALSGAAMPPGWVADPTTSYSSYTYPDILQTLEHAGLVGDNYPMKEPAFEKHVYSPPGDEGWREGLDAGNHSLIATTDPDNKKALEDMIEELRDK